MGFDWKSPRVRRFEPFIYIYMHAKSILVPKSGKSKVLRA